MVDFGSVDLYLMVCDVYKGIQVFIIILDIVLFDDDDMLVIVFYCDGWWSN